MPQVADVVTQMPLGTGVTVTGAADVYWWCVLDRFEGTADGQSRPNEPATPSLRITAGGVIWATVVHLCVAIRLTWWALGNSKGVCMCLFIYLPIVHCCACMHWLTSVAVLVCLCNHLVKCDQKQAVYTRLRQCSRTHILALLEKLHNSSSFLILTFVHYFFFSTGNKSNFFCSHQEPFLDRMNVLFCVTAFYVFFFHLVTFWLWEDVLAKNQVIQTGLKVLVLVLCFGFF